MKKSTIVSLIIFAGLFITTSVMAQPGLSFGHCNQGQEKDQEQSLNNDGKGHGRPQQKGHPGMILGKFISESMLSDVLVDLTSEDNETISNLLKETHDMKNILETYEIDQDVFKEQMDAKIVEMAAQLNTCEIITDYQLTQIIEEIEARASETDIQE